MKRIWTTSLWLAFSVVAFSQPLSPRNPRTAQQYEKLARTEKISGWAMFCVGTTAFLTGAIIAMNESLEHTPDQDPSIAHGANLMIPGAIAMTGSFYLISVGAHNQYRAMEFSTGLTWEKGIGFPAKNPFPPVFPAVGVKINWR
jgi:hypothetical protein